MKKLIIIGNGFDLAHDYKTSYKDFVEACPSSTTETFQNMVEKYCESELANGVHWYEFESMINAIAVKLWGDFLSESSDTNEDFDLYNERYMNEMAQINTVFSKLEVELKMYLDKATGGGQNHRIESITNETLNNTKAILIILATLGQRSCNIRTGLL